MVSPQQRRRYIQSNPSGGPIAAASGRKLSDVMGVDVAPGRHLLAGTLVAVEGGLEVVQAGMPAGPVARVLAALFERVKEGQLGAFGIARSPRRTTRGPSGAPSATAVRRRSSPPRMAAPARRETRSEGGRRPRGRPRSSSGTSGETLGFGDRPPHPVQRVVHVRVKRSCQRPFSTGSRFRTSAAPYPSSFIVSRWRSRSSRPAAHMAR